MCDYLVIQVLEFGVSFVNRPRTIAEFDYYLKVLIAENVDSIKCLKVVVSTLLKKAYSEFFIVPFTNFIVSYRRAELDVMLASHFSFM
jgi:hypothetical protein